MTKIYRPNVSGFLKLCEMVKLVRFICENDVIIMRKETQFPASSKLIVCCDTENMCDHCYGVYKEGY